MEKSKLRVFIAAGPERLGDMVKSIEESTKFALVGSAVDGEASIAELARNAADIALVDFALPRISGVKVCEFLTLNYPEILTVQFADTANPDYFRAAMLSGAREFLVLPLTPAEIEFALERVAQIALYRREKLRRQEYANGAKALDSKILVVVGVKGGTGATFIAANLAAILAAGVERTAIVEFTARAGDLAGVFDAQPAKTLKDLIAVVDELDPETLRSIGVHCGTRLDLFVGSDEHEGIQVFAAEQSRMLWDAFRRVYDLIVVDAGSVLTESSIPALEAADLLVMTANPEVNAVRAAVRLLGNLEKLGMTRNNMRLLLNRRQDGDLSLGRLADHVGVEIIAAIPESRDVALLLNDASLLASTDRSELKISFDEAVAVISEELSLSRGAHVG